MSAEDVAQIVSAIAACGAVVAAAVQIAGLRRDALDSRAGEILGVAVDTEVVVRPVKPDQPGVRSLWKYEFTVHNPGRLPITSVTVRVDFSVDQSRIHYDGSVDAASKHLEMFTPLIAAHASRKWTRSIVIDHDDHRALRDTVATVSFTAADAGPWTNTWPDPTRRPTDDRRLAKRLRAATG